MTLLKFLHAIRRLTLGDGEVPTWEASTRTFIPSSAGGSSSSLVHQASVTLTDDQIKALPSALAEIVPAPGLLRTIKPTTGLLVIDASAGAYVMESGAVWQFYLGTNSGLPSALINLSGVSTAAVVKLLHPLFPQTQVGSGDFLGEVVSGFGATGALADQSNLALNLRDDFIGVSDYAGGHPDNSLVVMVEFRVVDFTLKRFLTQAESGWNEETGVFA